MSLDGNTIVVMGAGGAIGQSVCTSLVDAGAKVVAFDRSIARQPEGITVHECDATDLRQVTAAFERLVDPYKVDGLVNVAGVFQIVDFAASSPDQWLAAVQANLFTAMTTCRALVPAWLERGSGTIVNFGSTAGEYGSIRPAAAYAAAKGGIIAFSKSLAREVSPRGIRVNVVSPGPVQTDMLQANSSAAHDEAVGRTLLGRLGRPADIASAVTYLLSPDADWITGEVLRVNGGSLI